MKILNYYKNIKTYLAKEPRVFGTDMKVPTEDMPILPSWFWTTKLGKPRGINVMELRQYAKSCWVQMVVSTILKQIMTIEWNIVVNDDEDETDYSEDIDKIKTLLNQPNVNGDDFWDVFGPYIRDVLELDSGTIFKGRNSSGELVQLFTYDGSKFLFDVDKYGIINGYWQYSFLHPDGAPKYFEKNEIIYGQINRLNENFPYGWSPLQSIQQEVEVLIQSTRYNKEFFKNNAVPDGIVTVPMEDDQMRRFQNQWEQNIKGKPHKFTFLNVPEAKFTILGQNNKDMEWLEGQKWYFHTIFGRYGLSPQEVGFYESSNRSTGESQERVTVKNAIKPYLNLISDNINRDIIYELVGHDKLKFKWVLIDDVAEKIEHEQTMDKLAGKVYTINEVRRKEGLEPVEWGDAPVQEINPVSNNNSEGGKDKVSDDRNESVKDDTRKLYSKLFSKYLNDKK